MTFVMRLRQEDWIVEALCKSIRATPNEGSHQLTVMLSAKQMLIILAFADFVPPINLKSPGLWPIAPCIAKALMCAPSKPPPVHPTLEAFLDSFANYRFLFVYVMKWYRKPAQSDLCTIHLDV